MTAIGNERLAYILKDDNIEKKDKIDIAINCGVTEKITIKRKLTKDRAEQLLTKVMDVYFDMDNYPQYFDAELATDITNAEAWDIIEYDENTNSILAVIGSELPTKGEVVAFRDDFGIANVKYIDDIEEEGEAYRILLSDVENISDIMDSVSFSGMADFSYLSGERENPVKEASTSINPFVLTAEAAEYQTAKINWIDQTVDIEKKSSKCDISAYANIKKEEVNTEFSVSNNGDACKYSYSSKKDKVKKEGNKKVDAYKLGEECKDLNKEEKKNKISGDVKVGVEIKGLQVAVQGFADVKKPTAKKNYVEVNVKADSVRIESQASLSTDEEYKIATIPVPIAATGGSVSVDINIYLVVDAEGNLAVWYEIDNPSRGARISVKDGIEFPKGKTEAKSGLKASVNAEAGVKAEAEINVFKKVKLANPSVDVRAYAEADFSSEVPEGYMLKGKGHNYTCGSIEVGAPMLKLNISDNEDTVVNKIMTVLKKSDEGEVEVIAKDEVPFKCAIHVETSKKELKFHKLKKKETQLTACSKIKPKPEEAEEIVEREAVEREAVEDEIEAKDLHFRGLVIKPEDVVLKAYDAMQQGKYDVLAECVDPESEKIINLVGGIASSISNYFTGENMTWGELLYDYAGEFQADIISCKTTNMIYDSEYDFLDEFIPNVPGLNTLLCTEADVKVKYRYVNKDGDMVTTEEIYHTERYPSAGWRMNMN